jgi:general secretion pathway protein J
MKLMKLIKRQNHGFTLIEILVSLSIVTIITGLLYGTFRSTLKTAEAVEKETDSYRMARIVFYQITKDLTMFNQITPAAAGSEPVFGATSLLGENKTRFFDGVNYPDDTIVFMSLSAPPVLRGFSVTDQAEISYSISEESLVRNTKFRDKPVKDEVGEFVLGFNLRYYDNKKKEWLNEWDPRLSTGMPLAMEITLILKGDTPLTAKTFRTTVGIPLADSL